MSGEERERLPHGPGLVDSVRAALNGVLGERLAGRFSALTGEMSCSHEGEVLQLGGDDPLLPDATGHVCVLAHALMTHEGSWQFESDGGATDYGRLLQRDFGMTPVYVRYNTGRALSANGAELDVVLEHLVARWPVRVEAITLIGHSMGGLVIRAAFRTSRRARRQAREATGLGAAARSGRRWRGRVRQVVLLGAPNTGAWGSQLSGSLADWLVTFGLPSGVAAAFTGSSEGMRELRHGLVDDRRGWRRVLRLRRRELPRQARLLLMAASIRDPQHLLSRFMGDGLVASASALGHAGTDRQRLTFRDAEMRTVANHGHRSLATSPEVYEEIRAWLSTSFLDTSAPGIRRHTCRERGVRRWRAGGRPGAGAANPGSRAGGRSA